MAGWVVLFAGVSAISQVPAVFNMLRRRPPIYGPTSYGESVSESFGDRFTNADGFTKFAVLVSILGFVCGAVAAVLAAAQSA